MTDLMRKLFALLLVFATVGLVACSDDDDPIDDEEETEKTATLVYCYMIDYEMLDILDAELTAYEPTGDKTVTIQVDENSTSMYGDSRYSQYSTTLDMLLLISSTFTDFDINNKFVYYHVVNGMKNGDKYNATAKFVIDQPKLDAITSESTRMIDNVVTMFYIESDGTPRIGSSFSTSTMTISTSQIPSYIERNVESISGTLSLSSN